MASDKEPDPEELIVKSRYFVSGEIDNSYLQTIRKKINQILQLEGYRQSDVDPVPASSVPKTMDFRLHGKIPIEKHESAVEKARNLLLPNNNRKRGNREISNEEFLEGLRNSRDDLPFRFIFHFKTYEEGDVEGYDIDIESIPVLLQKYRQLAMPDDYRYNTRDIVSQNKREIKRIMGRLGLEPIQEPYTEAETLETDLSQQYRKHISKIKYGGNILQYLDEGDTCFQRDLYHAALSCYIHAIEWTIITYLSFEEGKDVIDEQKQNEAKRYYFSQLIELLQGNIAIEQKTMESLNQYKDTERHWIAHHKSGMIPESRVEDIRQTLLTLIGELFSPVT